MQENITKLLNAIDMKKIDFTEWFRIGMALKQLGCTWQDWDALCKKDSNRYQQFMCEVAWKQLDSYKFKDSLSMLYYWARCSGWDPKQTILDVNPATTDTAESNRPSFVMEEIADEAMEEIFTRKDDTVKNSVSETEEHDPITGEQPMTYLKEQEEYFDNTDKLSDVTTKILDNALCGMETISNEEDSYSVVQEDADTQQHDASVDKEPIEPSSVMLETTETNSKSALIEEYPLLKHMSTLQEFFQSPKPLPKAIIENVLRYGHKMLIAGPSKAGKSYLLMQLAISIVEGIPWLGFLCQQGNVLYVNLEIDEASCFHRLQEIYKALQITPDHAQNLHLLNLRGKNVDLEKLTPVIIAAAQSQQCHMIIIDPIYKILTGDENSASDMAKFCNYFDQISQETGCAMVYCHHHSKGSQKNKAVMDRSSGSGVFARDPDAVLDLTPSSFSKDDAIWTLTGVLREFPSFTPKKVRFTYPTHVVEITNTKKSSNNNEDVEDDEEEEDIKIATGNGKRHNTAQERKQVLEHAYQQLQGESPVTTKQLAQFLNKSVKTITRYVDEFPEEYRVKRGIVTKPSPNSTCVMK